MLGGYGVLDLRAAWRFTPQWRLEAKLLNALDHRIEPVRDYQGPRPPGLDRHPLRRPGLVASARIADRAVPSSLTALVAAGACGLGVLAGSTGIGAASPEIFWQIRVPRVLAGFGAGAALALAGALMQLLTRNALADPTCSASPAERLGRRAQERFFSPAAPAASLSEWRIAGGAAAGAFLAAIPAVRPARTAPRRPDLERARGQLDRTAAGRA